MEVKVIYNDGKTFWVGRNGRTTNGGLGAFEFSKELDGLVSIDLLNKKGEIIIGGGVMPADALDDFCRKWLEARGK
jgi:hypothetical protein